MTEECLLAIQGAKSRAHGDGYERLSRSARNSPDAIWLEGCASVTTRTGRRRHRAFTAPGVIVLAEEDPAGDENHRRSADNYERLQLAFGSALRVVKLPYPHPIFMNGERLPASYANFYIANGVVLVPTFNDPNDRIALNLLAERFPDRRVVGIHAVDLVWGLGTLHCLTQQQPRA